MGGRALVAAVCACAAALAAARPEYGQQIPNGQASERAGSGITCLQLGHTPCAPGAPRNAFGQAFAAAGFKWTAELCQADSDGDGVTNGMELGDPCCLWTPDNPDPAGFRTDGLSHPGDADQDGAASIEAPVCTSPTTATTSPASATTSPAGVTTSPATATTSPSTATTTEDDGVCFPASARAVRADGRPVRMDALRVGDEVRVGGGGVSRVFMFTHRTADARATFLTLRVPGAELTLTPGHYVHVGGKGMVPAREVRAGDMLFREGGKGAVVQDVSRVAGSGLYSPQTLHGDIVVEGVVVSTYTEAVHPLVAHALLAPLRAAFEWAGVYTRAFDQGAPRLAEAGRAVLLSCTAV